jgi:hypothetical protein
MGQPKITFNRTEGIGAEAAGQDHISGLITYHSTLPAGFGVSDRIKKIFSLQQAEDLGIVDTYTDETAATGGQITIDVVGGTAGNVTALFVAGANIGQYAEEAGDAVTDVGAGLRAAINALTIKHGFVATAGATDDIVQIAPDTGMGVASDSATISATHEGSGASTIVQMSSGAGSFLYALHYHISEYFRLKPDGVLYVGIFAEPATFNGDELQTIQNYAGGEIRQAGWFVKHETFAGSLLTTIQADAVTLRSERKPIFNIFHADMTGLTLATLPNLSSLTASKVMAVLGEDGNFHQSAYSNTQQYLAGQKVTWINKTYIAKKSTTGNAPHDTDYWSVVTVDIPAILGYTISTVGAQLGATSNASVSTSTAYVEQFQLDSGNILSVAGFATGDLYKDQAISLLNTLTDYHYTYLRSFNGLAGTYFNDTFTAIAATSDYATQENNRTMDKSERLVYTALLPKLNSPITLNADGTMTANTINIFKSEVIGALDVMLRAGEISAFSVEIDPAQDVLQTSTIEVTYFIVPIGVAREIEVNNSFTVSIS